MDVVSSEWSSWVFLLCWVFVAGSTREKNGGRLRWFPGVLSDLMEEDKLEWKVEKWIWLLGGRRERDRNDREWERF